MSAIERLLVRLPNWLGDVLLARRLLHALRRRYPGAEIRAIAPAPLHELLAVERTFDRADAWPSAAGERAALAREVREWRPSAALVLPPSFSSAWFAWRTAAPIRIGYAHEARGFLLTRALPRPPRGDRHQSDEYLELGRPLGVEPDDSPTVAPPLAPPPGATAVWEARRRELGITGKKYAVLGPGAKYGPAKRWSAERFAKVGRLLTARGLAVLVCGVTEERPECDAVARAVGDGAITLAGGTDLAVLRALCAGASIAVCNDSGLAHLAAATGAPTVVVFGSTSSAWTAPIGPRVRVVQRAPVCSPCFRRTCRIGYRCLEAVQVDDVAGAAVGWMR